MSTDDGEVEEIPNPVPARGVIVKCALNLDGSKDIPFIYFGRESREADTAAPDSPAVPVSDNRFKAGGSSNPLNSVVRRLEAQLARHGGLLDSGDFVSTNGRGDDRYYHADDFLDNGDEEEMEGDFFESELDLSAFRMVKTVPGEMSEDEEVPNDEEAATDDEEEMDGGNWQTLLSRLDQTKQHLVRDVVVELEAVQAFPGHTRQKKLKSLRELTAKLRRLLPKINQVQAHWQAAVWEVVTATNVAATMQSFLDLWNDVSVANQRDEISKERGEFVQKINGLKEISAAWQNGEAVTRPKHEAVFNALAKLWELWNQEEECLGRLSGTLPVGSGISRVEKRFAAHLNSELLNSLDESVSLIPYWVRIALSNKAAASEDKTIGLPATIFLYKKNELLKCKLLEIKSLTQQVVQVVDKEWTEDTLFESLADVFESYQQKYVRKQDRVKLGSQVESWKFFSVKKMADLLPTYFSLYDVALSTVGHFGFTDKGGYPVFLPSIGAARQAEMEKRKKIQDAAEERKRKREEMDRKNKMKEILKIPLSEFFVPFPEFDKILWKLATQDIVET